MGNHFSRNLLLFRIFVISLHVPICQRCVIIKGEKSDNGIKHLQIGLIILKASQSSNPWIGNFQTGDYFIYYDGNYMSDNCDWFDNQ